MENFNVTYKQIHEQFMQNHTGTSIEEILLILTPSPITIFMSVYLAHYINSCMLKKTLCDSLIFISEFIVLVVSQLLLYMLPVYNFVLYMIFFGICIYLTFSIIYCYITTTVAHKERIMSIFKIALPGRRPYITYFRSSVNLITTICILAVDFTAFPRKFAKTEIYGFGLMDTGVGFFIVSNGLVARHVYKEEFVPHRVDRFNFLLKELKKNSVLIILGFLRVISVRSVDYHNHNSEYGVHWNFFITLACTRFISAFMFSFVKNSWVKYLAFFLIVLHQTFLSLFSEKWILSDAPRENLIDANKEGIVSLLGYISLYLWSVEIGNKLHLKSSTFGSDVSLVIKLLLSALLCYFVLIVTDDLFPCSRRFANSTYIIWVVMLSLYLIALCLLFELILRLHTGRKNIKEDRGLVPSILLSINFNPLSYFLLSNIFTGAINLSIKTLYISEIYSVIILFLYMFLSCSISKILFVKQLKIV